jgi:hypothetical protein
MNTEEFQIAIADMHKKTLAKLDALRPAAIDGDARAAGVDLAGRATGLLLGIRTGHELAIALRIVGEMYLELSDKLSALTERSRLQLTPRPHPPWS